MILRKMFTVIVLIFALIGFVLVTGYVAVETGLTNTAGVIDSQRTTFINPSDTSWTEGEEWPILELAIRKDANDIKLAARISDVNARMIVSILVVEQLRLFHSDRELFKKVLVPLKILVTQSQFSLGVVGIKRDTAEQIEDNLRDPASPWYLGREYEHLLDFGTTTPETERFRRLTNDKDRYYSYLYAGLSIKQILHQWAEAGIPIKKRPDIIATLFNIGFEKSKPHPNPQSGGAEIVIGSESYSFGGLALAFYESDLLADVFPR